jgi:pyruvate/2-oxoglutarate dehydrogenase complex dihydrolipoamide acyltransferase (E2) component
MAERTEPAFQESPWPVLRNALVSYMNTQRPNSVQGCLEMDVTDALCAIRRVQKELRIAVSFHSYMLHCMVRALILHPLIVSYRRGNKLIRFDDIDVLTPVEKKLPHGGRIPTGYILRAAQRKSLAEINWELRQATRAQDIAGEEAVKMRRRFARWPGFMRNVVSWRARRDPFFFKRLHGTVILTNVQPHGFSNAATVFGPTVHTFSLALGTVADRLKMNERNEIVNRKILLVGASGDHDVVDGMVAARFMAQMTRFVESADCLDTAFIADSRRLIAGANS